MTRQKIADPFRRRILGGESGVTEFLLEIAVQIEIGATRIDEHVSSVVIQEKGNVHAFAGDFDPLLVLAMLLPLPHQGSEVIAGAPGDGGLHGVGSRRESADFNHAQGRTTNLRKGGVENQSAALKQTKSIHKESNATAKAD